MKKLLFVIFFPITIPVYIYFKICSFLFSWIIDTFIPFMKNKAFPAFKSKNLHATNKFMQKRAVGKTKSDNRIEQNNNNIEKTERVEALSYTNRPSVEIKIQDENINKSYTLSTSLEFEDWFISIVGHLPPFTDKEYRKIKKHETLQQIKCLKKYQKLDSFDACYESGKVYEYWGADYRLLAIKSFEECLKYPPTLPIGIVYSTLATLYEKNHQFEEAVEFFQKDIDEEPYYSSGYNGKARCLVKLGKFDEAIDMLEAVKDTEYYKNPIKDPAFARSIDRTIEKCIAKKERGYIFKPRNKSFDYIDPNNFSLDDICNEYLQKWS